MRFSEKMSCPNDHPIDKASYTFVVTAPADLQVVANGRLLARKRHGAKRTWVWNAPEPMASYLATVDIGRFATHRYRTQGLWMYDALDPDLFDEATASLDLATEALARGKAAVTLWRRSVRARTTLSAADRSASRPSRR